MRDVLRRYVTLFSQLEGYDRETFWNDVAAGFPAGVMLIPQGMAYALIAGLPPIYGLYAALLPPILYALVGSSRHLSIGPVALVRLLVASGVGPLAGGNVDRYVMQAFCLAALVGIIHLLMGLVRFGILTNFLSDPVLTGFGAAAALLITLIQLEHFLGVSLPQSEYVHIIVGAAVDALGDTHVPTLLLGLAGIALILAV